MRDGICGIFAPQNKSSVQIADLDAMLSKMQHPNGIARNTFMDSEAGIALGSLSRSSPEQPDSHGWSESEDFVLAIDGHVTSHSKFNGHAAEINAGLLAKLRQNAASFPAAVDGHFAMSVWNRKEHKLTLIRDPFGVKPLFYCQTSSGMLVFASELKALLAHPAVERTVNREALIAYLAFGFVPPPYCIFDNILKVCPAEKITIDAGQNLRPSLYWQQPDFSPEDLKMAQFAAATRERVLNEIARHVKGRSQVGLYFSGGLDSTIVLAALQELGVAEIHTFTLGFTQHTKYSALRADLDVSADYARSFGARHHEIVIDKHHNPLKLLPEVWHQLDEPILSPNFYSKALLAKAVKESGIELCLNGGMAELGFKIFTQKLLKRMKFVEGKSLTPMEMALEKNHRFLPFGTIDAMMELVPGSAMKTVRHMIEKQKTKSGYMGFIDLHKHLMVSLVGAAKSVAISERSAALHQVDMRFPFLSKDLLQFARSIPLNLHRDRSSAIPGKAVLVKAFEDRLPEQLLQRTKVGFPSYYWNHAELDILTNELLSESALQQTGLLNPKVTLNVLAEAKKSLKKSAGKSLWGLLVLQIWCKLNR